MKNKKLMYGLLGVGAVVAYYLWYKNQEPKTCSTCKGGARPQNENIEMSDYSNASGKERFLKSGFSKDKSIQRGSCAHCKSSDGGIYSSNNGYCNSGDRCGARYA